MALLIALTSCDAQDPTVSKVSGAVFHHAPDCTTCHDVQNPSARGFLRTTITTPSSGAKPVVFTNTTGSKSFADGDATYDGVCEICHTTTAYHRNNASGDHSHYAGQNCLTCHSHASKFTLDHLAAGAVVPDPACTGCHPSTDPVADVHASNCGLCHVNTAGGGPMVAPYETNSPSGGNCSACHGSASQAHQGANHIATPPNAAVIIFADDDHDDAGWIGPKPYFDITVVCGGCHRTNNLSAAHGDRCQTCHPAAVQSLGTYNGTCSQGACHSTFHSSSIPAHEPFASSSTGDCNRCHQSGGFAVTQSKCLNCHANYVASDTTPPVTTTNALASYTGAALIDFILKDGGKVGIGTTFYELDGAAAEVGSNVTVTAGGSHVLKYWSIDQAGNVETPKKQAAFSIISDTTPPVTTSNAVASYYTRAVITLSATDASSQGVKATYYRIDGGAVQTGTTVTVNGTTGLNIPHSINFWSEDWSANTETPKTANFTITAGNATLRLVWGNADGVDPPYIPQPPSYPTDWADWYIRRGGAGGYLVASGGGANPGWDGVDDIVVPVSATPYWVDIWWWDSPNGWDDNTRYWPVPVNTPGQIIRLRY